MTPKNDAAVLRRASQGYWQRLSASLLSAIGVFVGCFTLAGFAARYHWRLEQLCHFRVQYFWLLSGIAAILVLLRWRGHAALLGMLALVNLATILPLYLPETAAERKPQSPGGAAIVPLRVVTFNVRASNQCYDDVAAYLRELQADVAIVLEINRPWSEALNKLQPQYPHQHHEPRNDNFGIAILSRLPWEQVESVCTSDQGVPSVRARFEKHGARWTVLGTHPVPPGSAATSRARNEQLVALAELTRRETSPVILAGDLNVTSWSPLFKDLLRTSKLRDSRQGRGVQPSWVSWIPLTNLPIDHILISPGIIVKRRSVGPDLGSDHRPVVADLRLPQIRAKGP